MNSVFAGPCGRRDRPNWQECTIRNAARFGGAGWVGRQTVERVIAEAADVRYESIAAEITYRGL